jgi:hypothetical protein
MKRTRITFRIALFSLVGLFAVLLVGGLVLSNLALKKFDSKLRAAGIKIRSLDVNLFARSLTIEGFEWQRQIDDSLASALKPSIPDSLHLAPGYLHVRLETIRASNISILALIQKKEIQVGSLLFSHGRILMDASNFSRKQAVRHIDHKVAEQLPFAGLSIRQLSIEDVNVVMKNDSVTEHMANVSLELRDVVLNESDRFKEPQAYSLSGFKIDVGNYKMTAHRSNYTLSVKHLLADSRTKEVVIDSVVLLPKYGKYQFSRRQGRQVDRFVLRAPKIALSGLDFSKLGDSIVIAASLKITDANLYVFRDKRLPFTRRKHMPLPVALIRTLPFGFAIDSLILADTKITYEEFPEKGFETGYIVFDRLQAYIDRLSNRDLYPGLKQAVLHVTSHVMQNGLIKVDFTLPYDKPQIYNARGRISNLNLHRLNPMLESLAFVRVESGRLNALDFNFDYDDYASRGDVFINYENLKLAGLKKEKGGKENDVKSFALGLFVRKDKNREVPIEKRTGKIYYERDRSRAIFNVWVKSLFSGVKSSVVDPPSERKPQTHKERRRSLREERKKKREEKRARQNDDNEKQKEKSDTAHAIRSTHDGGLLTYLKNFNA